MTNSKISGKQMTAIFASFWIGSIILVGSNKQVRQDYWISILMSLVFTIPMLGLYYRLLKLYPEKNLFEILIDVFGKILGRFVSVIYILYGLFIGGLLLGIVGIFVKITALRDTPTAVTAACLILVTAMASISGPETIGRISKFLLKFIVGFVYFSTFICTNSMKPQNLMPVMTANFKDLLTSSYTLFILPIAEAFICLIFFSNFDKKEKIGKVFIKSFAIAISTFLIVAVRNVMVLGNALQLYYFPSYAVISVASLGEFFSRFEILVGVDLVLAGLITICVCDYSSSVGLATILNVKDYRGLVVPCSLILLTLSQMSYKSTNEIFDLVPYFVILMTPVEVILPILTLIVAEIKHRMKEPKSINTIDDKEVNRGNS